MRVMYKRIISALIIMMMLFVMSAVVSAGSDGAATIISVNEGTVIAGNSVNIEISVENNPGILGAVITVDYSNKFELIDSSNGEAFSCLEFTEPGKYTSPCNFVWKAAGIDEEDIVDGTILVLTFNIPEDTPAGRYPVSLSCEEKGIVDGTLSEVDVTFVTGFVTVVDYVPGDTDRNGEINIIDVISLCQFLAGGYDVNVNELASDVDGNGSVNIIDVILICQYLAGGYGVELKPGLPKECHHVLEPVGCQPATCTESGNDAYWKCLKCGELFADSEGKNKLSGIPVIPAMGHSYATEWSFDSTYHWHEMTCGCDEEENSETLIASLKGLSEEEILAVVYQGYGEHSFTDGQHTCKCGYTESAVITFIDENGAVFATWEEEYGKTVLLTLAPEKLNKKFVGWYKDDVKVETYTVTGDAQFAARFVDTHLVVFVGNDNEIVETQQVADGEDAVAPNESKNPEKIGNRFVRWESYTNITEDTIIKAIFEPIQFELCVVYPDGEPAQEKQIVTYGEYSESLLSAEEYWLDKNTYNLLIFTGYEFDGKSKWSFADVEAKVWEQYEADKNKMPSVTINASYNKEYVLPFIVIEETASGKDAKEAGLNIVMPTNVPTYLFAVNMKFVCGDSLNFNLEKPYKLNSSSEMYKVIDGKSSKDNESSLNYEYRRKTQTFSFEWMTIDGTGITYGGRGNLFSLYFDCQSDVSLAERFVKTEETCFWIGESVDANELTKISPVVIYID